MTRNTSSFIGFNGRYATLDAICGLAALSVAIFHLQQRLAASAFNGYLAVDPFFVVSGFVLARTYESRFEQGLGCVEFEGSQSS